MNAHICPALTRQPEGARTPAGPCVSLESRPDVCAYCALPMPSVPAVPTVVRPPAYYTDKAVLFDALRNVSYHCQAIADACRAVIHGPAFDENYKVERGRFPVHVIGLQGVSAEALWHSVTEMIENARRK